MRRRSSLAICVVLCASAIACNALSGADGLTVSTKSDTVDGADIEVDSGKNTIPNSGGYGDTGHTGDSDAGTGLPVEASTTDASGLPTFFDDFARPDGTLGNGWMLKNASKYTLSGGAVKQTGTGVFANQVNRRPTSEDGLNFETSMTFVVAHNDGDPAIYARITPGSDADNFYQSYAFLAGGLDGIYLEREDIDHTSALAQVAISPPLTTGTTYRLTLKVTGTTPVHLEGTLDTATGTRLGSIVFDDNDAKRIQIAGSVGFGSGDAKDCRFDDFKRITLP